MVVPFYLSQRFLYMLAIQMRSVAIGWQVYDLTRRPLDLGMVGLMQFLPAAGFAFIAGQVVDRYNRKRILLVGQAIDALCSTAYFYLAWTKSADVYSLYAILFTHGAISPFLRSARQSLLPNLVSAEQFPRVLAWSSSVWQAAVTLGPALGGLLYGAWGSADLVYLVCLGCGVGGLAFLVWLPSPVVNFEKGPISWESLSAGLRFLFKRRVILGAISLDLFAVLLGGAVALLPIYARDILHTGPAGLGFLRAAPGIGAALTGVWLALFPIRTAAGRKMFLCVFLFGLFTILFGVSKNFYLHWTGIAFT